MKLKPETIGLILAAGALVVAIINYLAPFNPIGPSPFKAGGLTGNPAETSSAQKTAPVVSPTPSGNSTSVNYPVFPEGTVLFEDDFQHGASSNWSAGEGWEIRSDNNGNSYYCVSTKGSDHSYIFTGSNMWQDYALNVQVMVVKSSSIGSGIMIVRANMSSEYSDYDYNFGEKQSTISKEMGPPYTSQIIATTHSVWIPGKWQNVRFEAKGSYLSVYLDDIPILQTRDNSFTHGAIMLGAGGSGWDVCFDNVRVTALRR